MLRTLATLRNQAFRVSPLPARRCTPINNINKLMLKQAVPAGGSRALASKVTFDYKQTALPEMINSFNLDKEEEMLNLTFSNDETRQYPFIWLYDNCQCPACKNKLVIYRTPPVSNLELDISPSTVEKTEDGILINWNNGHSSLFGEKWLASFQFPAPVSNTVLPWRTVMKPWGSSEMQDKIPIYKYNDLIESDDVLYHWIETMKVYGASVIPDVGKDEDRVQRLAMRVGYPTPTNYGHGFTVELLKEPSNDGWEEPALPLHTDFALDIVPEIFLMHTIKHAEGGGFHEFVDGINAASQLRDQDPEAFHILSTTDLIHTYVETKNMVTFYRSFNPIIRLNEDKEIVRVHFSNHSREPELPLSAKEVKSFYKALKKYYALLSHPDNVVTRHTVAGEIVCLNNHRCLHGRSSYKVLPGTEDSRLVKGVYLTWQDAYSKQRVLSGMRDKFMSCEERV